MSERQNILITGASSVLIGDLIKKIDKEKYKILGVTRDKSKIQNSEIEIKEGDISNPEFAERLFRENKIDIVIHGAAVTHAFNPQDYFKVNVQATINLVNAAKRYNAPRFIFISSRTAGKESGAYGLSKMQAEEYIQSNLENYLIIRPSEIFGGSKNEGIDKLINDIFTKKIVVCPVNLDSKLFPIYNADSIQIIYDLIFNPADNSKLVIFNGKEGYTYYELIRKISKIIDKKIFVIPIPKFVMFTIKWMVEFFKLKIGFVPDQVPRLYSPKEIGQVNYNTLSIENYVVAQNKQRN